jgi:hypothetical protein
MFHNELRKKIEEIYDKYSQSSPGISSLANLLRNVVVPDLSKKYINELLQNADDAEATKINFGSTGIAGKLINY